MNKTETKNWLTHRVAELINITPAAIDPQQPFSSFGLDSVRLSALAAEVEQAMGRPINPAELFEHPSIEMLTDYLCDAKPPASPAGVAGLEPVAIVGMACRLPGASNKDLFWQLLESGQDAISEVPGERWKVNELYSSNPKAMGRTASKWGGFLNDVSGFDNRFFHISSDEAMRMDPQQRLLLELCWEALEDAGEIPARLRGSTAGVFVGISASEYVHRQLEHREGIGPYTVSGNSVAIAANRLSYIFDFRGPSLAVDTACSSSLVALHLACRAIAGGECDRAIVAGVNLLLDPEITIGLSKAGMLAPDGRCKPFDAKASGYVRGEGVGVVVLKGLSAARAANDRIYAVVRGSAMNQDGSTNGLTAPNPAAQRDVLRVAYQRASIRPQDVDYVECHGTGTFLGDPIEARSLGAVLGQGRSHEHPCYIGSVKSNIGHLEAAAGIAALIKTVLALHYGKLPRSLHFSQPNPHIAFDELGLKVVDRLMEWRSRSTSRLAGVSSFGFGGTNAHVVLESAENQEQPLATSNEAILPLSAVSRRSLQKLVSAWRQRLDAAPEEELHSLAQAACLRRTHHRPFRVAIIGDRASALRQRMAELENDFDRVLDSTHAVPAGSPRVAFVFSGQGSQFPGMARGLLESSSLFRTLIRNHDANARQDLGWSIEAALRGESALSLDDSAIAQPLLLSIQLALVKVWAAHGIEPVAVVGHSLGELAAAVTAGILEVRTAFRLASRRGQLMNLASRGGRMLATGMDRAAARALAVRFSDSVSVAAVNSSRSCVLAGEPEVLEQIKEELAGRQVPAQWLPVDYAFHSRCMDPVRIALAQEFAGLAPREGAIPIYSTVLGKKAHFTEFNAEYWGRGVRDTVEFAAAMENLFKDGVDAVVEIGPQAVLRGSLRRLTASAARPRPTLLASMERDRNERLTLLESLAELYRLGCSLRWTPLFPDSGRMGPLPAYCWDHERFWIDREESRRSGAAHFLLGQQMTADVTRQSFRWENVIDTEQYPYLSEHRVGGQVVFPATGFIEMVRAASLIAGLRDPLRVTSLTVQRPLFLDGTAVRIRTDLFPREGGARGFTVSISSASGPADEEWVLHATGGVEPSASHDIPPADHPGAQNSSPVPVESFYSMLARQGFEYGDSFRKLKNLWRGDGTATADLDDSNSVSSGVDRICLMDSALQLIAAAVPSEARQSTDRLLPYAAESIVFNSPAGTPARADARIRSAAEGRVLGDVTVFDDQERMCVQVLGLQLCAPRRVEDRAAEQPVDDLNLYEAIWRERPATPGAHAEKGRQAWLVLSGRTGYGDALAEELRQQGVPAVLCQPGERFTSISREHLEINPHRLDDYQRMLERVLEQWHSLAGVVHLWSLEKPVTSGPEDETNSLACESALHLLKALSFSPAGAGVRLLVATRGCQPASGNETAVVDPAAATIWGLLKTVPVENALLPLACVDLDPASNTGVRDLVNEMFSAANDLEVAYRDGKRFVRRITQMSRSMATAACGLPLRNDGTYVLTGGTGSLGFQVAEFLAQQGARRLALIARNPGNFSEHPVVNQLRQTGVEIELFTGDVSDGAALAEILATIRSAGFPIRGVVHGAGIREDGALLDMAPESLDRVAAPKVKGAWNLHRSTLQDPLDWFILFSSAAGVLGSPGQANYSSANAFLDSFAHYRHSLGLPALSIDWGPWGGGGMASKVRESGEVHRLRTGASVIDPGQGLALFGRLLQSKKAQVVVLPFDLTNLLQFYPAKAGMSFFEELATPEIKMLKSTGTQRSVRPEISTQYLPPRNGIEQRITAIWQRSLAIEPVGVLDSFFELGGDSVFANQMIVEVNRGLGVSIEPQRAFERLTVAHLAELAQEQAIEALQNMTDADAAGLLSQNATLIPS